MRRRIGQILLVVLWMFGCSKNVREYNPDYAGLIDYYQKQYNEFQQVDIEKAQSCIDSILKLSQAHDYVKGLGLASLDKGLLENVKGNYNLALSYNEKALSIFTGLRNDTLRASAAAALGSNYWQKGENDKALHFCYEALKINEALNLKNESATNYNQISMVHQLKGNVKTAEEFAQKAFTMVSKQSPSRSHIAILHNLANIYGMQGRYKDAMALDSIGLSYCEKLHIEFNKSMFYDNMANCLYCKKELNNSIGYHLKAIAIDSAFKNNKQLGDTYCNLGAIFEEMQDYRQAVAYYHKSLELCRNTGYKTGVKNALELWSALAYKQGNGKEAYDLLQQSIQVKDSMINEASEQKIAEMQTLFDTEKKKQQIEQQDLKISRRNILLIALSTILVLSLITYYLWYNRYKLKQEQKLQLELIKEEEKRTNAILESEENERQRLARELHDGVGQLLSATKLNLSSIAIADGDKLQNSMDMLDDSIKEIRNISHNMVPDVLQKLGLQRAIADFISRINQTKKLEIHFECNGFKEDSLNDTEKLMLYRIIQESVNNSIKYGQASDISIQLSADEEEISLLMEDNGKGFDVEDAKQKGGIGLKNMQLRTDYLKGKLEIESYPKQGTTIIVEIPLS